MCRVSQSEGSRPAFQAGPICMSVECASAHTSEGEHEPENLRGWKTLEYCRYCPNAHLGVFFLGLTSWQVQSVQLFKKTHTVQQNDHVMQNGANSYRHRVYGKNIWVGAQHSNTSAMMCQDRNLL